MPIKLSTTIDKIDLIPNRKNAKLIRKFHEFMKSNGASERHQNNNLKAVLKFGNYLSENLDFEKINNSTQILSFLDTTIKRQDEDPDKRWITTWNDYLHRIKHFLRWLHNVGIIHSDLVPQMDEWITPTFLRIKEKKTKRVSPYLETELWEKDEILLITKYEKCKRNKSNIDTFMGFRC